MFQLSPEAAVALVISLAGLVGWLTNMSFKLGSIKSALETEQKSHGKQLQAHKEQLKDHETRITTLEK